MKRTGQNADGAAIPRVLVVDDHRANVVAIRAILDPLQLDITEASSGEEALLAVLRSDFALILMDVQMPNLDGFATTKLIKGRPKSSHIPVIFVTATTEEEVSKIPGYGEVAIDILFKPLDPNVLHF